MAQKKLGQDVTFKVNGSESEYLRNIKMANDDAEVDTTSPVAARAGSKTRQLGTSNISFSADMMYPATGETNDTVVDAIVAAQAARATVTVQYDGGTIYTMMVKFADTGSDVDNVKSTAVTFILMEAPSAS